MARALLPAEAVRLHRTMVMANGYGHHGNDGDSFSLCGSFNYKEPWAISLVIVILVTLKVILTYRLEDDSQETEGGV